MAFVLEAGGPGCGEGVGGYLGADLRPLLNRSYSTRFSYFTDREWLLLVSPRDDSAQMALAYGLYYAAAEQRKLVIAVPSECASILTWGLPWLREPVEVFEFTPESGACRHHPVPTRAAILQKVRDKFGRPSHDLREMAPWVGSLVTWAVEHPYLVSAHRTTGMVWKCCGRKVLEIKRRGKTGLVVTGGVVGKGFTAEVLALTARVDDADPFVRVRAAVDSAIHALLTGVDKGDPEHTLQAYLARYPELLDLEPGSVAPEFPAVRAGGGGVAFIDLIGVDSAKRVHLVETKIGDDVMLVLQGLDYWIWGEKHAGDLAARYAVDPSARQLDYVVVSPSGRVSGYTNAQLNALADDVRWRLLVMTDLPTCAGGFDGPGDKPSLVR